jgi:hypothetical protein
MKKRCLISFVMILLIPLFANAESNGYANLGVNFSSLRKQGGKCGLGNSIGLGIEFVKPSAPYFAIEASYVTKKVTLQNKTWPSNMEPEWSDIRIGDIPLERSYFEFNLKLGYSFSLFRNKAAIELFSGPLLSFPFKYSSRFIADSTIFLDLDERGKYEFDFLRCDSEGADKFINWFMGITVAYKSFGIEFRYVRALSPQECIRGLTINDALDSFYFLLRYSF